MTTAMIAAVTLRTLLLRCIAGIFVIVWSYFTVTVIDVDCIRVPDVALTITVAVPAGVPLPVPLGWLFELPQPDATTSRPIATAIPTHRGTRLTPSRGFNALFRKYKSTKSNPANAKPNGPP